MISGNRVPAASDRDKDVRVRDDSQQLRDIQDLIARLELVNRQLSVPARATSTPRQADAGRDDTPGADD